ncbi:glycoside hydrolase family 19 protein, partial [Williamwhitmania taraxaci]
PFSPESFIAAQGTTKNLMDYSGSTDLWKHQWELIRDPESLWFAWAQDESEGEGKKLKGKYTVYVGDSVMTEKKIFINTDKNNKLYVKYESIVGDTGTYINVKVVYRPVWSTNDISWPFTTWGKVNVNTKTTFSLDSLPEGVYKVLLKNKDDKIDTVMFYLRSKKYEFGCSVCGRNLVLTSNELKLIFPNSKKIDNPLVLQAFNNAFKKSGFKTCNHFAHFLAQLETESVGLTKTTESSNYYLHRMLEVFRGNNGTKFWYKQEFWDNKAYLKFVSNRLYEKMDSAKYNFSVDSLDYETFTHKRSGTSIKVPKDYSSHANPHTIAFNGYKSTPGKGCYRSVVLTDRQKEQNGIRSLNAAYVGMDGNSPDTSWNNAQGSKYRGRGYVQVTNKNNYVEAKSTCAMKFKLNFDFVNNPDLMANDTIAVWASFAWFVKNITITDLNTENPDVITYKVNKAGLEADDRKRNYIDLRQKFFKCNKP